MPVRIDGKTYKLPGDSGERKLTMGEQRLIEREAKRPLEKVFAPIKINPATRKKLSEEKQDELEVASREVFLYMVWIARRRAGEDLTFEQSIDVEVELLEVAENDADPLEVQAEVSTNES